MMRPNYMEIKKEDLGSWNNYSDAILPAVILLNPELRGLLAFNSMPKSCNQLMNYLLAHVPKPTKVTAPTTNAIINKFGSWCFENHNNFSS